MEHRLQLISQAESHDDAIALRTPQAEFSYADILQNSRGVAQLLLSETTDLSEDRIGYVASAGLDYISTQWGIWRAGGIAVPLSLSATEPELEYALADSECSQIVATKEQSERVRGLAARLGLKLHVLGDERLEASGTLPNVAPERRAMILYTSGTTSKPKGVVSTHANIEAQIETLVKAWQWSSTDSIPLFLPLHHIHGIINVMSCALWTGAVIEPFAGFEMETILNRVSAGAYTTFMAVPTIYVKLIEKLEGMTIEERTPIIDGFQKMRLMISGSAALPATVHETWTRLTGQRLLERYGMTEIGMGLSNPYDGERRPGAVGRPLPGVEIRLKSEAGPIVSDEGEPGEIQVRGSSVFKEYWNRDKVTADSFDEGWFQTGDMAVVEDGYYRIMGRQSVDIIKSGGYKLSALEIEATLLDHPSIQECAVVGLEDDTWGESVAAAVVLAPSAELTLNELRVWSADRLSKYKIPKRLLSVDSLPRNAMGKVTKPAVKNLFGV